MTNAEWMALIGSFRPLHKEMLVILKAEDRTLGSGLLVAPDIDHVLKRCTRCKRWADEIPDDAVCRPEDIFDLDKRTDRYRFRGQDFSHAFETLPVPVVVERAREATVITRGPEVTSVVVGHRVLVPFDSGRVLDDDNDNVRVMDEDALLAIIEDDPRD